MRAGDPTQASALRWAAAALVLGALLAVWPMWPPLVLAAWTAGLARPVMGWLERKLRGRRSAASVITVGLVLGLGAPLGLALAGVVSGALELGTELAAALARQDSARAALDTIVSPDPTLWHVPRDLSEAIALAERVSASGWGVLSGLAGASARGIIAVFLYFVGTYTFLTEGPAAWDWVRRTSPLKPAHAERLSAAFHETGRGLLSGVGLTTLTQGVVATIIYLALGVPRALVLGPLTGLASMMPLVGSALVWGPVALGLWVNEHPVRAVLLGVLGVAVISTIDNLLRPFFSRLGKLQLSMFTLYVAIFGGLATVGPWGVVLGPLLVRLALEVLALLKEEELPTIEAP